MGISLRQGSNFTHPHPGPPLEGEGENVLPVVCWPTISPRFHPAPPMKNPVPVIVLAQLFGTSLWFSANSAADDLIRTWGIAPADIGTLTNAVQLGFILGTLSFAISGLADRFAASRIFAVCAVLGALCNAAFALFATDMSIGVPLRFAVGLCLAGVYPLGMKLVVSWVPERAGAALAQLVGMLTLGTALPHGIRLAGAGWSWQATILVSSGLALIAAAMILRLGDGPHLKRRHDAPPLRLGRVFYAFSVPEFPRFGPRLFRPPMGALRFLDTGPVAGRAERSGRRPQHRTFRLVVCHHRDRRPRLHCRGLVEPTRRQRPGRGDGAWPFRFVLRAFPVQRSLAGLGKNQPVAALGRQRGR
jgi:MFS family permease